jgi:hypothetical protein
MVSEEITRCEEHTLSVGVFAFFAGGGYLAGIAAVLLPAFPLRWSFFPLPWSFFPVLPGLGLPLGAAKTSSDSESLEAAAFYSDSSESSKRAAVERDIV